MKEKILSSFPYLFLALFFTVIFTVNSKTHVAEPVFALELTENIPEISTDVSITEPQITETEVKTPQPEADSETETQIIETKQDEINGENVCFYTKSGKKYHLKEDCRYLKNSSTLIKTTVEFAKELGLEPCSGCKD